MDNAGVIWLTDFPYNENPMFRLEEIEYKDYKREMSTSDWCADSTSTKVSCLLFIFIYFVHWYLRMYYLGQCNQIYFGMIFIFGMWSNKH